MNALVYIGAKTIKNHIKNLLKKPMLLLLYAFLFLLFGFAIFTTKYVEQALIIDNAAAVFQAGTFAVIAALAYSQILKGLDTGGSFFSMADVNFLFLSPISSSKILVYGMIKQTGTALLTGFIILAQSVNFKNFFGISFGQTCFAMIGFALTVLASESLAVLVYNYTNGSPSRKLIIRVILALILAPALLTILTNLLKFGFIGGAARAGTSIFLSLVPVAGWVSYGVGAFLNGNIAVAVACYGLNILVFAASAYIISKNGSDFYEDVLVATEKTSLLKEAKAQGDARKISIMNKKVRVRSTGISGWGASAVMGRMLRENLRLNPAGIFDAYSLLFAGLAFLFANMFKSTAGLIETFFIIAYANTALLVYNGSLKELSTHNIFMLPEKPLVKLLWVNGASALKALADSVLIYTVVALVTKCSVGTALALMLAHFCLNLMLLGLTTWGLRFFGAVINQGILLFAYILMALIALTPGIIITVIAMINNPWMFETLIMPAIILSAWEFFMAFIFFFWSRKVIYDIDMIRIELKKK